MSPRSPDLPNSSSGPARLAVAVWPDGRSAPRGVRVLSIASGALILMLLAAWAVPPMLDWGRFRTGIAAIAAAQLGRPVTLGGEVTFRLLPEAVLTASDVTLPDRGDGVSAQIGALRLQVAVLPLLAGRIVPRDLVLGTPVLRLPWPPPETFAHPARPRVPHAFSAHMENGILHIGEAEVTGINAGIHGGPEPAAGSAATTLALPEPATLGFGAEGFATFGGRSWRFTSALGAPDADGISALDLAVTGQGSAGQTHGTIQGILADGVLQGRLLAGGPDLSQLFPAVPLAWHAEAPFVADGTRIEARAIGLSLGGAPAEASLLLRLKKPARMDGRVHAVSIDLDGWVAALRSWRPGPMAGRLMKPGLPGRVEWVADSARLLGGTLRGLHGVAVSDGNGLALEQVETELPGAAHLKIAGQIAAGPEGPRLTGPAGLDAPKLHETLAWLRALAPAVADAMPQAALTTAALSATVTLGGTGLSAIGLAGQVDGVNVTGGFSIALGPRPHLDIAVSLDRLSLDEWLGPDWWDKGWPGGRWPGSGLALAGIGQRAARLDSDVHVKVASVTSHSLTFNDAALDMRTGQAGLSLGHAAAGLSGAQFTVSGAIAPDGAVSGGALSATAADLAILPATWRHVPGLWHGAGSLKATAAGAPDSLDVALRAEAGDLLFEADGRGDTVAGTASGTVTLRHPGAPRLLAALGMAGAEPWLQTGSVAVRADVSARPDLVSVQAFDLDAAALRMSGKLALDFSGAEPFLRGRVEAEDLALPPVADELPTRLSWLRGWAAQLSLSAARLTIGGHDVAGQVAAELGLGAGEGLVEAAGNVAGGRLAGQVAVDLEGGIPRAAFQGHAAGLQLDWLPNGLPVGFEAGEAELVFEGSAEGGAPGAWGRGLDGSAQLTVRNAGLAGVDIARAGQALTLKGVPGRRALRAALSGGVTDDLSGTVSLAVAQGRLGLGPADLVSPAGSLSIGGTADLVGGSVNLTLGVVPAGIAVPGIGLAIAGTWGSAHATPALGQAVPAHHVRGPRRR